MSAIKRNTTRKSNSKKVVIVTKSKVPAKTAPVGKLQKINKMLTKTKWMDAE